MRLFPLILATSLAACAEDVTHGPVGRDATSGQDASDAGALDATALDATSPDATALDASEPADIGFGDTGLFGHDASIPDADLGSGNIEIWVRGDLSPKRFTDGLSGQTPSAQTFGLGRLELMRSSSDPSPVVAFDHGAHPIIADMLGRTLVGRVRSASIAAGTYTYGRVLLTSAELTIQASAHVPGFGVPIPGNLTTKGALSDTEIDGVAWRKGQATFRFESAGQSLSIPGTLPPFPSTTGGSVVETSTQTFLLFPFSTPFTVDPAQHDPVVTTIVYEVYQSFRWSDLPTAGFVSGTFDVDGASMSTEPVRSLGATGYRTEP